MCSAWYVGVANINNFASSNVILTRRITIQSMFKFVESNTKIISINGNQIICKI